MTTKGAQQIANGSDESCRLRDIRQRLDCLTQLLLSYGRQSYAGVVLQTIYREADGLIFITALQEFIRN
jgi:hypothetical protein